MEGKNELHLDNLKVTPKDDNKMKQLTAKLTMPLDTAMSLLRDKDNSIRIKLPVHGDITDPKFEIGDIINKALGTALKKAAIAYVKHSIQPFGTLITIVEVAGKAARIRLDPVLFAPGSIDLGDSTLEYLNVAAKLMKDRPKLNLRICGKTTQSDIIAIIEKTASAQREQSSTVQPSQESEGKPTPEQPDKTPAEVSEEQLLDMAKERATVIKNHLVKQHGIDPKRLFICNPEIDKKEKAVPRADLLI